MSTNTQKRKKKTTQVISTVTTTTTSIPSTPIPSTPKEWFVLMKSAMWVEVYSFYWNKVKNAKNDPPPASVKETLDNIVKFVGRIVQSDTWKINQTAKRIISLCSTSQLLSSSDHIDGYGCVLTLCQADNIQVRFHTINEDSRSTLDSAFYVIHRSLKLLFEAIILLSNVESYTIQAVLRSELPELSPYTDPRCRELGTAFNQHARVLLHFEKVFAEWRNCLLRDSESLRQQLSSLSVSVPPPPLRQSTYPALPPRPPPVRR